MNPLQRLNAKQLAKQKAAQARKRAFERKAAAVFVSLLLLALCATQYQAKPAATIVAVDDEDLEPAALLAYAPQSEPSHKREQFPKLRLAVRSPGLVSAPKPESKKVAPVWVATLEERENIARQYLQGKCPTILKLEGMQTASSKARIDRSFMLAKSPGAVIAVVRFEIRNSTLAAYMCPLVVAGK